MKNGFTLSELLAALAVLGIVLAVAVPNYSEFAVRSRRTEARVALVETMQQQERYYTRHNSYAAFSADAPQPPFRWWTGPSAARSAYEMVAAPCQGLALSECVELRAIPGSPNVDPLFVDTRCGALYLRSDGSRGAEGEGQECWP